MRRILVTILVALPTTMFAQAAQKRIEIDLQTAIRIGTTNHFALQAIQNRKLAIRQLITERWRAYLPAVGLSYNRTRDINQAETDSILHEVRLNVTQVIYDGGRRDLDLDLARIDALLARDDFEVEYNKIRLEVQRAYFRVLAARGKVKLAMKSLERAEVEVTQARREEQLGFTTRVQVLTVAARVREIQLALERARNEYRQSLHDLALTLNLDFDSDIHVAGDLFTDFYLFAPRIDLELLVRAARSSRAEVKRSTTNLHRLNKEREIAEDAWIPQVTLNGYVGRSGSEFPVRDKSWGIGLGLKFPLGSTTSSSDAGVGESADSNRFSSNSSTNLQFFDDLSYDRRILESKINLGQGVADHKRLFNQVAIEVVKAKDRMMEAWESMRIGNGRTYFQFESLRLGRARLGVGEIKRSDLMLQEIDLVQAQNDLTDALAAYIVAGYELEFQAGLPPGDLKFFEYRPGEGNSLLRYLALGDFNGARNAQERQEKQEKMDQGQQLDRVGPLERDKMLLDEIK